LTEEELSNQSRVIELVHTLPPLFQFGTTTVVRVSRDTVIKRIGGSSQTEALSLRYVRDHTTILVPQVKNFFAHPTVGSYVTMDYIEGQTLSQCWRHIGLLHKLQIAWKLRGYIHQLRRLRRSIPGPIDNSYCTGRFFTENGAGPFETEGDMIDWFNHKLDIAKARKDAPETTAQFEVGEWPLVFTHQDLCRRNIMLARNGDVYIIDWTTAGFYPEWLEYPCMAWYIDEPWLWRAVLIPIIIGFGYSPYRRRLSYMGWALTFGYFM
jgi:aminoglycoside phosphotransferase (APT) family kinase protein